MKNEQSRHYFVKCPHCLGKGTCLNNDNLSCGTCLKEAKVKKDFKVVVCSVCGGTGVAEPKSSRLNSRLPYFIASIILVVFYAYAAFSLLFLDNFTQVFPVVGSLTTMIVTFYFSQKK